MSPLQQPKHDIVELVPRLRRELRRRGHTGAGLYDGAALDLLRRNQGDVNRAASYAEAFRLPGTFGMPGCRQIGLEGPAASTPLTAVPSLKSPQLDEVTARAAQEAADRDLDVPEWTLRAVAALAEAMQRAAAVNGRGITRASSQLIAGNAAYLWRRNDRVYSPPLVVLQGLYPQVSMNGANMGWAEKEYGRAIHAMLPDPEFGDAWEAMQLGLTPQQCVIARNARRNNLRPVRFTTLG